MEEENFFGKTTPQEPSPERMRATFLKNPETGVTIMDWEVGSSGYSAVWATENTREALFDAMERRETYATTGTRLFVRFFGGWGFTAEDAHTRNPGAVGYHKGVPMGGDLGAAPTGAAPTFLVAALRDPIILDADKEGFLRSARSLIQTCGRAARHVNGMVILYADSVTPSMQQAMDETGRRRKIQQAHNETHRITPESIQKAVTEIFDFGSGPPVSRLNQVAEEVAEYGSLDELDADIRRMEKQMHQAAKELVFERAAELRDRIKELQKLIVLET